MSIFFSVLTTKSVVTVNMRYYKIIDYVLRHTIF